MNNQGWGLRVMLGFCGILALCIIIVAVTINNNFKSFWSGSPIITNNNNNKPGKNYIPEEDQSGYHKIEGDMIKSAQRYIQKYYPDGSPNGTRLTVTVRSLQDEALIGKLTDPINSNIICSGYVNVIEDKSMESYEPYLKCGERYETSGYLNRLDDNV